MTTNSPQLPPPKVTSHNYAPWVNVVLGLLVFALRYGSPRGTFTVHWNLFLTGLVIMFAALAATIAHDESPSKNYWSAINVAAGTWLLVSAETIPSVPLVTAAQKGLGALIVIVALASLILEFLRSRSPKTPANRRNKSVRMHACIPRCLLLAAFISATLLPAGAAGATTGAPFVVTASAGPAAGSHIIATVTRTIGKTSVTLPAALVPALEPGDVVDVDFPDYRRPPSSVNYTPQRCVHHRDGPAALAVRTQQCGRSALRQPARQEQIGDRQRTHPFCVRRRWHRRHPGSSSSCRRMQKRAASTGCEIT